MSEWNKVRIYFSNKTMQRWPCDVLLYYIIYTLLLLYSIVDGVKGVLGRSTLQTKHKQVTRHLSSQHFIYYIS